MCATDRSCASFRKTKVLHFAFLNEVLDRACHVFDRYIRVNTVLVEQIDGLRPESLQGCLGNLSDMLWTTIHAVGIQFEPELGGDHHLIADGSQGLAYELFVHKWPIDLSRIKEGYATFYGCADQ